MRVATRTGGRGLLIGLTLSRIELRLLLGAAGVDGGLRGGVSLLLLRRSLGVLLRRSRGALRLDLGELCGVFFAVLLRSDGRIRRRLSNARRLCLRGGRRRVLHQLFPVPRFKLVVILVVVQRLDTLRVHLDRAFVLILDVQGLLVQRLHLRVDGFRLRRDGRSPVAHRHRARHHRRARESRRIRHHETTVSSLDVIARRLFRASRAFASCASRAVIRRQFSSRARRRLRPSYRRASSESFDHRCPRRHHHHRHVSASVGTPRVVVCRARRRTIRPIAESHPDWRPFEAQTLNPNVVSFHVGIARRSALETEYTRARDETTRTSPRRDTRDVRADADVDAVFTARFRPFSPSRRRSARCRTPSTSRRRRRREAQVTRPRLSPPLVRATSARRPHPRSSTK